MCEGVLQVVGMPSQMDEVTQPTRAWWARTGSIEPLVSNVDEGECFASSLNASELQPDRRSR